jgi:hypothetical protein
MEIPDEENQINVNQIQKNTMTEVNNKNNNKENKVDNSSFLNTFLNLPILNIFSFSSSTETNQQKPRILQAESNNNVPKLKPEGEKPTQVQNLQNSKFINNLNNIINM